MADNTFSYLLDRIAAAEFQDEPFPHLYLEEFLSKSDFDAVTRSPDVSIPPSANLGELFTNLADAGYVPIPFPGCTTSREAYVKWLEQAVALSQTHPACEGQGMALRMNEPSEELIRRLDEFFRSAELHSLLRAKFAIDRPTYMEAGLQKYLHGYEISPHPDIRKKALTWMLNVNPGRGTEKMSYHTHYLRMRPERAYVVELWKDNFCLDTSWVPWEWCTTERQQTQNNSIVIFSPRWDTIHAVKAHYDHLPSQRTQFYGNLWYEVIDPPLLGRTPSFHDLDFIGAFQTPQRSLPERVRKRAVAEMRKLRPRANGG